MLTCDLQHAVLVLAYYLHGQSLNELVAMHISEYNCSRTEIISILTSQRKSQQSRYTNSLVRERAYSGENASVLTMQDAHLPLILGLQRYPGATWRSRPITSLRGERLSLC